jgi:hypothetical protein
VIPSSSHPFLNRLKGLPDRYQSAILLFVTLGVFVVFNKAAFQSYFSDDDFANLALFEPWWSLVRDTFTLALLPNFRPVGAMFYKAMGPTAGFHFAYYVAALQTIHVATSLLLWLFLRRLGLRPIPAALGCAFFMLHVSSLPAYWKPMYVYDVLCGFWVVLSLLLYQRGRFVLSLLCAWLAFKSKEMELMLPVVLLGYEWFFGRDQNAGKLRWRPLIPFFLISMSFGLQSLMIKGPETVYTMHVTAANVWAGISYYGGRLFYAPFSGLIISIGLLFLGSRFVRWGVIGFWLLIAIMFGFPGREFGAYLYVPLLCYAVAVAGVAQAKPLWAALFLVLWIPASYEELQTERKPLIAYHYEHLPYVTQILESLKTHRSPTAVVYDGSPIDFNAWGQEGLFPFALSHWNLPVYRASQPEAMEAVRRPGAILFTWDNLHRQVFTDTFPGDGNELAYVDFAKENPIWQLKSGWNPLSGDCRFTKAHAIIALRQPAGDTDLVIGAQMLPEQEKLHQVLRVSLDGRIIGEYAFDKGGLHTPRWPVTASIESLKDVELDVNPMAYPDTGVQICRAGFVPRQ